MNNRGRLSIPMLEVGIGILLIFSILTLITINFLGTGTEGPQLEIYADDTATVIAATGGENTTAIGHIDSQDTFEQQREDIDKRISSMLPEQVKYYVKTPYGTVGDIPPPRADVGTATQVTPHGEIEVNIYYV
ncbi:hypothetical protein K0C01_06515 [Salinarchaeum sp. IM2453]|uniref:DUF7262 family protein n=1 Tax=Salinarchaeum sp. IM2453 TaxID=2862870 RepID=UPI001C82CC57|nr:hypothetical protein [Salinarchaeum sp. IM2453]QZA87477.1 hypothetical protein K0C01_06515 [Salinarchaeum sp. IM2453]